jgi:hypothetical protein
VIWVVLSPITVLPFTSWMVTRKRETLAPSAAIVDGLTDIAVFVAVPGAEVVKVMLQPVSEPELREIWPVPAVLVEV